MTTSPHTSDPTDRPTDPIDLVCRSVEIRSLRYRAARRAAMSTDERRCNALVRSLTVLLYQSARYAEKHRLVSLTWSRLHYVLGLPAAVLAAWAGALVIGGDRSSTPGYLALAAGAVGACVAFLKCENSRDRNSALCAGWTRLGDGVVETLIEFIDLIRKEQSQPGSGDQAEMDRLLQRIRQLHDEKMNLLWGVLHAGPPVDDAPSRAGVDNGVPV